MNGFGKFIVGGVVTSLMAMAAHSVAGFGPRFIDQLQDGSTTAIGEAGGSGVSVRFDREPALRRTAILSGPADAAMRERLLAAVRAVPGVADARWADGAAPAAATTAVAASPEAVVACQSKVDAAIAGQSVQFDRGKATISAGSAALVDALAAVLGPCDGTVVAVAGHTDPSGNAAANQTLSQARADAVVAALAAKGVPAARMTANGYGSSRPKVTGRGAAADAANRRIEFTVASGAAAAGTTTPAEGN